MALDNLGVYSALTPDQYDSLLGTISHHMSSQGRFASDPEFLMHPSLFQQPALPYLHPSLDIPSELMSSDGSLSPSQSSLSIAGVSTSSLLSASLPSIQSMQSSACVPDPLLAQFAPHVPPIARLDPTATAVHNTTTPKQPEESSDHAEVVSEEPEHSEVKDNSSDAAPIKHKRPSLSYAKLAALAIDATDQKQATVGDIYKWILDNFPYFKQQTKSWWKNCIRHNLSMKKCFMRIPAEAGGSVWILNPAHRDEILNKQCPKNLSRKRRRPSVNVPGKLLGGAAIMAAAAKQKKNAQKDKPATRAAASSLSAEMSHSPSYASQSVSNPHTPPTLPSTVSAAAPGAQPPASSFPVPMPPQTRTQEPMGDFCGGLPSGIDPHLLSELQMQVPLSSPNPLNWGGLLADVARNSPHLLDMEPPSIYGGMLPQFDATDFYAHDMP